MKIKRTNLMRVIGKKYLNFFGILLTAPKARVTDIDMNHERIHEQQAKELLYVFFYIWYGVEYIIRLIQYRDAEKAYKNISFEREAYQNENDLSYLEKRMILNFLKYIK